MIQPNQSITISTGLKIKTGAPILVISKQENLNLYSEIVKDCNLSLTFTNLSNLLVELRPGDVLAKLFSNSNSVIVIEEELFDQIHPPVSYLPNLPFPFIGNQTIIDSYQYKLPSSYIHSK